LSAGAIKPEPQRDSKPALDPRTAGGAPTQWAERIKTPLAGGGGETSPSKIFNI
jgi:hypothetical protein